MDIPNTVVKTGDASIPGSYIYGLEIICSSNDVPDLNCLELILLVE